MTLHDDTFNDVVQVAKPFCNHNRPKLVRSCWSISGVQCLQAQKYLAEQVMSKEFVQVLKRDVIYRQELENVSGNLNSDHHPKCCLAITA